MANTRAVFFYRIRNWRAYNRALINCGRLTVWFDEHPIAGWRNTELATGPGAPRLYADLAIACALVLKSFYHRSLRAVQGFLSALLQRQKRISIARKQQEKALELRATMILARLWRQQDKHHDARTILFEISHWFTEGFDTSALKDAKALLEELGGA